MKEKPLFIKRLVAFMLDTLLVSFAVNLVTMPFIDTESIQVLQQEETELTEKFSAQEIGVNEFIEEYTPIYYRICRKSGINYIAILFVEILYFIIYQFYNKGQTLGKKLMKLKVVSTDGELTMNKMVIRSLIANSILIDMIIFAFIVFASQNIFVLFVIPLSGIESLILIISAIMVMFGKKGYALHDFIAKTEVVAV